MRTVTWSIHNPHRDGWSSLGKWRGSKEKIENEKTRCVWKQTSGRSDDEKLKRSGRSNDEKLKRSGRSNDEKQEKQ